MHNLRKRPFLIVNIVHRPSKRASTSVKGWGDDPSNWDSFEQTSVVDSVKSHHMQTASVIIDVMNGTTVKNRFSESMTSQQAAEHYLVKYKEDVTQAMSIWMSKLAKNKTPSTPPSVEEVV